MLHPGIGKTRSDADTIANVSSSLTSVPTHSEVNGVFNAYESRGIESLKAFPEMNGDSCQAYGEAKRAMSWGLSPAVAVCPACEYRETCNFRQDVTAAEKADHQIITHKRLELTGGANIAGKQFVSVHERCVESLRPRITLINDKKGRLSRLPN